MNIELAVKSPVMRFYALWRGDCGVAGLRLQPARDPSPINGDLGLHHCIDDNPLLGVARQSLSGPGDQERLTASSKYKDDGCIWDNIPPLLVSSLSPWMGVRRQAKQSKRIESDVLTRTSCCSAIECGHQLAALLGPLRVENVWMGGEERVVGSEFSGYQRKTVTVDGWTG